MQIVILKPKNQFRKEDLKRLGELDVHFYEERVKLEEIKELFNDNEKLLAVQPLFIEGIFESLPIEKLKEIKNLKALCLATTAFGWIDGKWLRKNNIILANCPGKATNAVAEGAYFSMTALLRKIPLLIQNGWKADYSYMVGEEALDLKVGIIGLGRIGERFAQICSRNGLGVSYWNRTKKKSIYKADSIKNIFKKSDVVYLSFATDKSLEGFINNRLIDSMKKSAMLISCIDNFVYDREYIIKKVQKGELFGCAFEAEDVKTKSLKGNIFVLPDSYYFSTRQTRENESKILTETIMGVVNGKPVNVVN